MHYTLFEYARRAATESAVPFIDLPYLREFCAALEDCVAGTLPNNAKNLLCCIAPRHYKTTFGARYFPAWCLAELAPDCEFILTSYSKDLATDSASAIRSIIESPWHQKLYPHIAIASTERELRHYFRTTEGGSIFAAPLGGAITGFGAGKSRKGFGGAIIIDDPLKANDAKSAIKRKNGVDYYNGTLKSRRNSVHNTPIILIAQRLHPDDLPGWILQSEPESWHLVTFPAVRDGKVLNPVTTSIEAMDQLKAVAPQVYWPQYQQKPMIQGGNIIKTNWWKTFTPLPTQLPDPLTSSLTDLTANGSGGLIFLTADTAFKAKSTNDASVIRVWQGTRKRLYCLDAIYGRWEFPLLLEKAASYWKKWEQKGAREFWVEDKASGTPLAQLLRDNSIHALDWSPTAFDFPDDKTGRMNESAWSVYGGHIFVPEGEEKILLDTGHILNVTAQAKLLIEECAAFSADMSHAHDDHCDTLTMAVSLWKNAGGTSNGDL